LIGKGLTPFTKLRSQVPHVPLIHARRIASHYHRDQTRSCDARGTIPSLCPSNGERYHRSMTARTSSDDVPTISYIASDGALAELLYDPVARTTALAAFQDGTVRQHDRLTLPSGERLVPYSATNNLIAHACILLPSDVGDGRDKREVYGAVQAFLHRYVDISPAFEEIAAYYVLLSWVYDAFSVVPYLRVRGDYGTGKSRALLAIGSLCYKPFFASGASTVSPIFHILDAFQGTLILDEADFQFSDATAELTKVLNNGNMRGLPVLRTMTNRNRELNPTAFRVFGPKIIGMRRRFTDDALESRFITEETGGRPLRADIPLHLPDTFDEEARALRNRLLGFRFHHRHQIALDPGRAMRDAEPRLNQVALPLLSLVDDDRAREHMVAFLLRETDRARQERADSLEAVMVKALIEAFEAAPVAYVSIAETTDRFNQIAAGELGRAMNHRWVGGFIRNRLGLSTMKTRGVFVVPQTERPKLSALAQRFDVTDSANEAASSL